MKSTAENSKGNPDKIPSDLFLTEARMNELLSEIGKERTDGPANAPALYADGEPLSDFIHGIVGNTYGLTVSAAANVLVKLLNEAFNDEKSRFS